MEVDRQYTEPDQHSAEELVEEDEEYDESVGVYDGTAPGSVAGSLRKVPEGMKLGKTKSVQRSRGLINSVEEEDPAQAEGEDLHDPELIQSQADQLLINQKFLHIESELEAQITKTDLLIDEKLNAKGKKKK